MAELRRQLEILARSPLPVVLVGETGTGKSYLAEHVIHARSAAKGPFVVTDLSTVPPTILPAHLFGSRRGAYTGSTEDEIAPNRSLSDRIHDAVEHDAWTLHWQPIVELSGGKVVGAEALIRWHDVNGGIVPPGQFLPIAEELGLIESIGDWVVDEVGRQDAAWRAKGLELLLSFNLAPRQLWSAHLSEKLIGRLRDAGVAPGRVILDIAEGTAMADPERAQKVMAELQCWGLKLAIDDFGTAHSSFARLVNFPVDYLKIDRQFVRGVDVEPGQAALVRAITSLADSLSVSPVAVGVETEGEADFLRRLGVPFAQGFLFGRPMEGDAMVASFATHGA